MKHVIAINLHFSRHYLLVFLCVLPLVSAAALANWSWQGVGLESEEELFAAADTLEVNKQAFLDQHLPFIQAESKKILRDRLRLLTLYDRHLHKQLDRHDKRWVRRLAEKYNLKMKTWNGNEWNELVQRVDAVPVSLVIAQAALESAWGTSRFAREGNNLYGVRCYSEGCGMIPGDRPDGHKFEVRAYSTPRESIRHYIRILNTHEAYQDFRKSRALLPKNQEIALKLAYKLGDYSELSAHEYARRVKTVIRRNDLVQYDVDFAPGIQYGAPVYAERG